MGGALGRALEIDFEKGFALGRIFYHTCFDNIHLYMNRVLGTTSVDE
jgi:hypothetical protein